MCADSVRTLQPEPDLHGVLNTPYHGRIRQLGDLGTWFISDIVVSDGVCVRGYKVVFIR